MRSSLARLILRFERLMIVITCSISFTVVDFGILSINLNTSNSHQDGEGNDKFWTGGEGVSLFTNVYSTYMLLTCFSVN